MVVLSVVSLGFEWGVSSQGLGSRFVMKMQLFFLGGGGRFDPCAVSRVHSGGERVWGLK